MGIGMDRPPGFQQVDEQKLQSRRESNKDLKESYLRHGTFTRSCMSVVEAFALVNLSTGYQLLRSSQLIAASCLTEH